MPTRNELIAYRLSVEEIRERLSVDSLGYLSLEGLRNLSRQLKHGHCDACFSAEYPVRVDSQHSVPQLSLFRSVGEQDDKETELDRRVPEE
jgi:amidophosphoribosyltransferase